MLAEPGAGIGAGVLFGLAATDDPVWVRTEGGFCGKSVAQGGNWQSFSAPGPLINGGPRTGSLEAVWTTVTTAVSVYARSSLA
jgi:hypothetical protein